MTAHTQAIEDYCTEAFSNTIKTSAAPIWIGGVYVLANLTGLIANFLPDGGMGILKLILAVVGLVLLVRFIRWLM